MMPQKRNPDVFELIRGRSGRAVASLMGLCTVLKGLPGGYNRDLQEDRRAVLETGPLLVSVLDMLRTGLRRVHFREEKMRAAVIDDYLAARRRRFAYVRAIDRLLGADGVVLSPVMAVDATTAEGPGGASPGDWYVTDLQNITGHPAISLPAGLHPSGVPFGLQVTAPRFREDLLLDLAAGWEEAYPWPLTAPGYEPFGT
jgi:hypothetical protein